MSTGVVVVAGGAGTRLGAEVPKSFVEVGGRPLIEHALERAVSVPGLAALVLVVPSSYAGWRPSYAGPVPLVVVPGGLERGDSVLAGVHALPPEVDVVLIHDAARAFTPTAVFASVEAAVRAGADGAVPGVLVVDTVKEVDETGRVVRTPDRASLRSIQTPQAFRRGVLLAAHAEHGSVASDDAALVERAGGQVRVIPGDDLAFKVTTPADLDRAVALAADGIATPSSIGART